MNALSLIAHPVTEAEISCWRCVADMREVIDTVKLTEFCVNGGKYLAEEFTIEGLDCRIVSALVLHECAQGPTLDNLMMYQTPALGLMQEGDNVNVCMTDWCLDAGTKKAAEPEKPSETICEKYERFQCCLDQWLCGERLMSISMNGRTYSYSAANCEKLERRVRELKAACDRARCRTQRRTWVYSCG
jgi:hypothetical protein